MAKEKFSSFGANWTLDTNKKIKELSKKKTSTPSFVPGTKKAEPSSKKERTVTPAFYRGTSNKMETGGMFKGDVVRKVDKSSGQYSESKNMPKILKSTEPYDNTPQPSRRTEPEYKPTTGPGGMQKVKPAEEYRVTYRTSPRTEPRTEPRKINDAMSMAQGLLKRPTKQSDYK